MMGPAALIPLYEFVSSRRATPYSVQSSLIPVRQQLTARV